ncbi:MAG: hypothetical protein U0528_10655 [Anaerolineae bacterium]
MKSMWRLLRGAVKWGAISYLLALAAYLFLRLMFGDRLVLGFLNSFAHLLFLPLILALPILALLRSRWSLLGIGLVLVAAMWFAPYFLRKAHASAVDGKTLRVLTFNVWAENVRLADVESWLGSTNADVILLQENPLLYAAENGSINNLRVTFTHTNLCNSWHVRQPDPLQISLRRSKRLRSYERTWLFAAARGDRLQR